jgi:hypothetical protein
MKEHVVVTGSFIFRTFFANPINIEENSTLEIAEYRFAAENDASVTIQFSYAHL